MHWAADNVVDHLPHLSRRNNGDIFEVDGFAYFAFIDCVMWPYPRCDSQDTWCDFFGLSFLIVVSFKISLFIRCLTYRLPPPPLVLNYLDLQYPKAFIPPRFEHIANGSTHHYQLWCMLFLYMLIWPPGWKSRFLAVN